MKMTVTNKCIRVGAIDISGVGSASIVLIGDAEVITGSSYFDTPADSLVYSPNIPLKPVNRGSVPAGKPSHDKAAFPVDFSLGTNPP